MDETPHGTKVAFVGLGRLGGPLAANLVTAGFSVTGYDPDPAATGRLAGSRVAVAGTAAEAIRGAAAVLTCVRSRADLDAIFTPEHLTADAESGGSAKTVLDLSTISTADSAACAARLAREGVPYLRVAVSGSAQAAAGGQVSFFCSGPKDAYELHTPLLEAMGRSHVWVGGEDEARAVKIAVNVLVGIGMAALVEAVNLAESLGIDRREFLDVVAGTPLGSPFFAAKTPALIARDFAPAASLALITKDLDLALEAARQVGAQLPVTQRTQELYRQCHQRGWSERDFACIDDLYTSTVGHPAGGSAEEEQPCPQ
jgi:3-hydroxyisobutyrate dehydrogenase-like beta-hydroxyacid dehydrogenase